MMFQLRHYLLNKYLRLQIRYIKQKEALYAEVMKYNNTEFNGMRTVEAERLRTLCRITQRKMRLLDFLMGFLNP